METTLTMDVEQAGKLLGLSRRTAYRLAAAGTIPTMRLGRKLRVSKLALDELLRRGVLPATRRGGKRGGK